MIKMGCLPFKMKKTTGEECIQELSNITGLLTEMMNKYDRQVNSIDETIRDGIRMNKSKNILKGELRKKKIILAYMEKCQKQIDMVTHRKLAVEQLNITSMQIQVLKSSASAFQSAMKDSSLEKIEKLQDTMEDLTDNLVDINEALDQQPIMDFDDDDLESELQSLLDTKSYVATQEVELTPLPLIPTDAEGSPVSTRQKSPRNQLVAE